MQIFFWVLPLKEKAKFQQRAQRRHDELLKQFQKDFSDYGYWNFSERYKNRWFMRYATFEKINPHVVATVWDNRPKKEYKYGMRRR